MNDDIDLLKLLQDSRSANKSLPTLEEYPSYQCGAIVFLPIPYELGE